MKWASRYYPHVPFPERFMAHAIDLVVTMGLCLFPRIGWIAGLIYYLTKEAIPGLKGQSIGKKFFDLQVVTQSSQTALTQQPEKSILRGLVSLLPIINIVDVYYLLAGHQRLADKWAQTTVIKTTNSPHKEASE
jgi:uncharacterized RDD family membrane protein YckC